jgi:hypothetical protein
MDQWWALINMVEGIRVPKSRIFLGQWYFNYQLLKILHISVIHLEKNCCIIMNNLQPKKYLPSIP